MSFTFIVASSFRNIIFSYCCCALLTKLLLLLLSIVALTTCEYVVSNQFLLESFVLQNLLHAPSTSCSSSLMACQATLDLQLLVS